MSIDNLNIPSIVARCQEHKGYNIAFAKKIWQHYPGDKLASRIYSCSDHISTQGEAIVASSFCRERLCPVCQWRKSQKLSYQNDLVLQELEGEYRFIFLTLTVRNCTLDDLRSTINRTQSAYKRLYQRTWFQDFGIRGYIKSLEITYNPADDSYHPHLHIILVCNKGSWLPSHDFFMREWGCCLEADYQPWVDIRVAKHIHEVSKYIVKSKEFLNGFDFSYIHDLSAAIKGLRFCSFGGVVKVTRNRLCLTDPEKDLCQHIKHDGVPVFDWSFDFSKCQYGIH